MKYCYWFIPTIFFWIFAIQNIPAEFTDLGGDSAQYIILAESLAHGKGFRMANYPQEPFSSYYPPVFPLLLTPIIFLGGRNFYLMHLLVALLGYTSLFFLYLLFKKYADKKTALLAIGLLVFNWSFIHYCSRFILSDIAYLSLSSFTLFFANRYIEKNSTFNKDGLWLTVGLALSYLTRYIGLTLFLGIIISLLFMDKKDKPKFKRIIFIGGGFLLVYMSWAGLKYLHRADFISHGKQLLLIDPYAPHKGSFLVNPPYHLSLRFVEGVNYYYGLFADVFFPAFLEKYAFLKDFFSGLIMFLLLLGLWRKFRENKNCVFHFYFIIYFLFIIFWPFREGVRLILPVLPFIFFYCLGGLKITLNFLFKKFSLVYFNLLICIFLIFSIFNLTWITKSSPASLNELPRSLKNFVALHQWIKPNLPPGGIIISRKPTITYFYTGHKALVYPYTAEPDEIWREILKHNAKYILVDEFSRETYYYLSPFLYKFKGKLALLQRIGDTGLFEIIK